MTLRREDVMRLLVDIDQQIAELRDVLEVPAETESESDEWTKLFYRMVWSEVARKIAEDHLKADGNATQPGLAEKKLPSWDTLMALYRLSKNGPED